MGDNGLIEHLRELLSPHAQFDARRMFGGWGIYLDGLMCGLVADSHFYLKTTPTTRAEFEAVGSVPFVFDGKGKSITMSYWSAPEAALESADAMAPWARIALAAAQSVAATRRRPAPKRAASKGVSKR